jgi:hypothetical protein
MTGALVRVAAGLGTGPQLAGIPGRTITDAPGSMNCRTFRKSHMDFVDGLLAREQSEEMYAHVDECARCARHDLAMRRGLLVARNLPQIEPSSDFMVRLQARIHNSGDRVQSRPRRPAARIMVELGTAVAVAVGVILISHARKPEARPAVVHHAAMVAAINTPVEPARPGERARVVSSPEFSAGRPSAVTVLLPAAVAGQSTPPSLIDAALRIPSLTP